MCPWGPLLTPGLGARRLFLQITYQTSIFLINNEWTKLSACTLCTLHNRCLWYWFTNNKSSCGGQHWLLYDIPGQHLPRCWVKLPNFIQHWGYGFRLFSSPLEMNVRMQVSNDLVLHDPLFTPSSKISPFLAKSFHLWCLFPALYNPNPLSAVLSKPQKFTNFLDCTHFTKNVLIC